MKKILAAMAIIAMLAGCTQTQQAGQQAQQPAKEITATITGYSTTDALVFQKQVSARGGQSLFDALKDSSVKIEYKEYSFGVMLTKIDKLEPAEGEYIAIYVNGEYAEAGVSEIMPEEGDEIQFRAEKMELA